MNITDIKIRKLQDQTRMRAVVSVTFDNEIVVHDIKVIEGPDRFFLAMPSRKMPDGTFRDIMHPITIQTRERLEQTVLKHYHEEMEHRDAVESILTENGRELNSRDKNDAFSASW